jgi:hypothetical protein
MNNSSRVSVEKAPSVKTAFRELSFPTAAAVINAAHPPREIPRKPMGRSRFSSSSCVCTSASAPRQSDTSLSVHQNRGSYSYNLPLWPCERKSNVNMSKPAFRKTLPYRAQLCISEPYSWQNMITPRDSGAKYLPFRSVPSVYWRSISSAAEGEGKSARTYIPCSKVPSNARKLTLRPSIGS